MNNTLLTRAYCGVLLSIWVLAPYFILQRVELVEVLWLEESKWDRMIPRCPEAIYIYVSYFLQVVLAGVLVDSQRFVRFIYTVGWVTLVSHMVFLFFPSGINRGDWGTENMDLPALYRWVVAVDAPRNCLPSLHCSLSVISALAVLASQGLWFTRGGAKGWAGRLTLKVFFLVWTLLVLWSTIALRQHLLVDVITGTALGIVGWLVVLWIQQAREKGAAESLNKVA